jgi:hypothetical protein
LCDHLPEAGHASRVARMTRMAQGAMQCKGPEPISAKSSRRRRVTLQSFSPLAQLVSRLFADALELNLARFPIRAVESDGPVQHYLRNLGLAP